MENKTDGIIELFNRHYKAIEKRGYIHKDVEVLDWIKKSREEDLEANKEAYQDHDNDLKKLSQETIQEEIDAIMVRVNMLKFYGVDFKKALLVNTKKQETRKD